MKTLIIDDEPFNLQSIRSLMATNFPEIHIVGEALSGEEGLELISRTAPDLVLLDIQMPRMTGFEMLEKLDHYPFSVIFITAYNQYAIQAIRISALDYLLKPVQTDELRKAIFKAQNRWHEQQMSHRIAQVLEMARNPQHVPRLVLSFPTETLLIELKDIIRCESNDSYTKFFLVNNEKQSPIVVAKGISDYEEMLGPHHFLRCHQSHIVNLAYVSKLMYGESQIELKNGKSIPIARAKKEFIKAYLKKGAGGLIS